jgi:hypothetical protein
MATIDLVRIHIFDCCGSNWTSSAVIMRSDAPMIRRSSQIAAMQTVTGTRSLFPATNTGRGEAHHKHFSLLRQVNDPATSTARRPSRPSIGSTTACPRLMVSRRLQAVVYPCGTGRASGTRGVARLWRRSRSTPRRQGLRKWGCWGQSFVIGLFHSLADFLAQRV